MARINIEDKFFGDSRFLHLCSLTGSAPRAIGICVLCWRMGQKYFAENLPIPFSIFRQIEDWKLILKCGLAKRVVGGVYVSGSREYFHWYFQKCEAARKSVKSRMKKSTTVQRNRDVVEPPAPAPAPAPALDQKSYNKTTDFHTRYENPISTPLELISYWNGFGKYRRADVPIRPDKWARAFEKRPDVAYWKSAIDGLMASEWHLKNRPHSTLDWLITSGKADDFHGKTKSQEEQKRETQNATFS